LNRANDAASAIQLLLASICAVGIILLCPILFKLIGGNLKNYANVVSEAGILMLGYIFLHLYYRVSIYYLVNHESHRFMVNSVTSGVIGIVISIILMLTFGTIGIYIGFVTTNALLGIFFSFYARARWSIKWPIKNLTLAVAVVVGAIFLSRVMTDLVSLFLVFFCIFLLTGITWFILNVNLLKNVKEASFHPVTIN
jgi:O-antigen/teichoic acid export membrane protein